MSEKSIIRPTFSYIGNFVISDNVFKEIIEYLAEKNEAISDIIVITITKSPEGPSIYVEVKIRFGYNIKTELETFKQKCIYEIENQTTMNVQNFRIIAKKIELPEEIN